MRLRGTGEGLDISYIIAGIMLVSCALPFIARVLEQRQRTAEAVEVSATSGC